MAPARKPSTKSRAPARKPAARKKAAKPAAAGKAPPAAAEKIQPPAMQTMLDRFVQLRSELDHMIEDVASGFRWPEFTSRWLDIENWPRPRLVSQQVLMRSDLSETDKAIELRAELPGMTDADIDVTVSDDVLTVTGKKSEEKEEKGKEFHLRERSFGSFRRSFRLPAGVDANKIAATFEKGVLTVTVPKPARPKAPRKKIAVARKG